MFLQFCQGSEHETVVSRDASKNTATLSLGPDGPAIVYNPTGSDFFVSYASEKSIYYV